MVHRRRQQGSDRRGDPFATLGLPRNATADEIRLARNQLAKQQHPDLGGSHDAMQAINAAAAAALAHVEEVTELPTSPAADRPDAPLTAERPPYRRVRRDHPSFTIEALPAEAFEALLIAGSVLGQVGDDDPPYRLDVLLDEPPESWCRLELVPDGGGSTVSLTVSSDRLDLGIGDVRDRFVAELNRLDWADDGPRRPPPW